MTDSLTLPALRSRGCTRPAFFVLSFGCRLQALPSIHVPVNPRIRQLGLEVYHELKIAEESRRQLSVVIVVGPCARPKNLLLSKPKISCAAARVPLSDDKLIELCFV